LLYDAVPDCRYAVANSGMIYELWI